MTRGVLRLVGAGSLLACLSWQPLGTVRAQSAPSCVFVSASDSVVPRGVRETLAAELRMRLVTAPAADCATLAIAAAPFEAEAFDLELRTAARVQHTRVQVGGLSRALRERAFALAVAGLRDLLTASAAVPAEATGVPPSPQTSTGASALPSHVDARAAAVRAARDPRAAAARDARQAAARPIVRSEEPPLPRETARRARPQAASVQATRAASWFIGASVGGRLVTDSQLGLPMLEARGGWRQSGLAVELALLGATTAASHRLGSVSLFVLGLRAAPLLRLLGRRGPTLWLGPQLTFHGVYIAATSGSSAGVPHDAVRPLLTGALRLLSSFPFNHTIGLDLALELGATPIYLDVRAAGESLMRLAGPFVGLAVGIGLNLSDAHRARPAPRSSPPPSYTLLPRPLPDPTSEPAISVTE